MSDIAIRCESLRKQYRIGEHERYKALRDVITEAAIAPFRRLRGSFDRRPATGDGLSGDHGSYVTQPSPNGRRSSVARQPSSDGFVWALDDISFEVKRGEV